MAEIFSIRDFFHIRIYNLKNENFLKIHGRDIYFDDYELNKGNDNEGNVQ